MVATLQFSETNTAGTTVTDNITNMNYGSSDSANITPASAPVTIPPSGNAFSYEKYNRVKWASGTGNRIDNMKFWKQSGAYVTGETLDFNLVENVRQNDAYATPVNTDSSKADQSFATSAPATNPNVFTPQSGSGTANVYLAAINDYTDYIVWQATIASTASPGSVNQKVFRLQYDEQ